MPRDFTNEDRQGMADLIGDLVRRTFLPDAGVTLGGQPVRDFLAGSAPSNPWSAVQYNAGREACRRWAAGKGSGILPSREAFMRDTCTPFIESEYGPVGDASADPPFPGGQCTFAYQIRGNDGTGAFFIPGTINGPLTEVSQTLTVPIGSGVAGTGTFRIRATNAAGGTIFNDVNTFNPSGFGPVPIPVGGGPDTCGDLPGEWDPGAPVTGIPGPAPIPPPPGMPWPFPGVDITVNPDGTIGIDFGDDTPPETVDPGVEPSCPVGPPPGGGTPATPVETEPGVPAEDEAPPGEMLWGLKVNILETPENPNVYAPGVYRAVCYIYMGDDDGLDHDPAGAMMTDGQFVLAERDYLTKFRVAANIGYKLSVTPYYKPMEAET
jgi:hypothetical protein